MEIVTNIAPIALAIIMLGLGASLTLDDFLRVFKNPKDFFIGFICQLIVLPIVAYLLVITLSVPIEMALGVMLIAAAPGGVTSNVLTQFANGDVALSISLTAVMSLLSIVTVPFIVINSINIFDITYVEKEITMVAIALKMFFVVTVPVIIGMIIRHFSGDFVIKNLKLIQRFSIGLFLIVFAAIYIEEWDKIVSFLTRAGLIALILNLTMMVIGFYVAKFFASGVPQQRAISLECGLQNGTLAVFVATQLFDNIIYMVPTAAYALVMMATSVIFVFILRKSN
ncbi:MAG: bile acid:sodium symporter family protein [Candidatus Pelagibacter bacterium]|nr:bile acid:sodium symporter family protein [Candidatus Pelagibacter bacterium]